MNRDHVGMIFKFLPKEEQKELRKLKPEEREFLMDYDESKDTARWTIDDRKIDDFHDQWRCFRPKGFLSWNEMMEDFEKKFKGKTIKFIGEGKKKEFIAKFEGKWLCPDKCKDLIELRNGPCNTNHFSHHIEFFAHLPNYGFEIV